jgi:hypothetical protein
MTYISTQYYNSLRAFLNSMSSDNPLYENCRKTLIWLSRQERIKRDLERDRKEFLERSLNNLIIKIK